MNTSILRAACLVVAAGIVLSQAESALAKPLVAWSNGTEVVAANTDGTGRRVLARLPYYKPPTRTRYINDVAVTPTRVLWLNDRGGIGTMTRTGRNARLVTANHPRPPTFHLVADGEAVFWIEAHVTSDVVYRMRSDGTGKTRLFSAPGESLGQLLQIRGSRLLWAENPESGGIRIVSTTMAGDEPETLGSLPEDASIWTVSVSGDRVFWLGGSRHAVYRANLDGSDVRIVAQTGKYAPNWIATGVGRVFWGASNWSNGVIRNIIASAPVAGGPARTILRIMGRPGPGNLGLGPGLTVGD